MNTHPYLMHYVRDVGNMALEINKTAAWHTYKHIPDSGMCFRGLFGLKRVLIEMGAHGTWCYVQL